MRTYGQDNIQTNKKAHTTYLSLKNLYISVLGDKYLNFMLGGGIELAAYLLAFVVLGGWGRQGPLVVYLALRNTNVT